MVVWIGGFKEFGKSKIDPYISLKEGGRVYCGEYRVETQFVARFKHEFDLYRVGVTFELARKENYRMVGHFYKIR